MAQTSPTEFSPTTEISQRRSSCRNPKVRVDKIKTMLRLTLRIDDRNHRFFDPETNHSYPDVRYEDVMADDQAVLQWLDNIVRYQEKPLCFNSFHSMLTSVSGYGDSALSKVSQLIPNQPRHSLKGSPSSDTPITVTSICFADIPIN